MRRLAPALPGGAVGVFDVLGEAFLIHEGGGLHAGAEIGAEVGEAGPVVGEVGGEADEFGGGLGGEFGESEVGELTQPARETGVLPMSVTTGTPMKKESRLVVWPL